MQYEFCLIFALLRIREIYLTIFVHLTTVHRSSWMVDRYHVEGGSEYLAGSSDDDTNVGISQRTKEMRVSGDRGAMINDESVGTRVMSRAK